MRLRLHVALVNFSAACVDLHCWCCRVDTQTCHDVVSVLAGHEAASAVTIAAIAAAAAVAVGVAAAVAAAAVDISAFVNVAVAAAAALKR